MSRRQCCVWGCSNRKGRCPEDVDGVRICGCSIPRTADCPKSNDLLTLHSIDVMPTLTKQEVIKKINMTRCGKRFTVWTPSKQSVICNLHYEDFAGPSRKDPNRIPVHFKRPSHGSELLAPSTRMRRVLQRSFQEEEEPMDQLELSESFITSSDNDLNIETAFQQQSSHSLASTGFMENERDTLKRTIEQLTQDIRFLRTTPQRLDVSLLSSNAMHLYSGLSHSQFAILLKWLTPVLPTHAGTSRETDIMGIHGHLTLSQKLLLTLMRIRCGFLQDDLGIRFTVDQSTISRTLNQWIPLLARQLERLIQWPQTTIGPSEYPYSCMPNTIGIIDGTEIFIERPSNLTTQKSSWSDYKSHSTVKYLVAIDPFTGVFTYVSSGFSGNASDRFIVENSTFLDYLQPGQRILADRGFTVRDLLARRRAFLTIPSFLRSAGKLTGQDSVQTRAIASVRIKVENAIKRMKDYKIFQQTQPNRTNKKILDDMVIIACSLSNLQSPLIKS